MNRGGSWNNNDNRTRVSNRNRNEPDNRNNNLGFRLVLSAPSPARVALQLAARPEQAAPRRLVHLQPDFARPLW